MNAPIFKRHAALLLRSPVTDANKHSGSAATTLNTDMHAEQQFKCSPLLKRSLDETQMPKLKGMRFATAVIERCKRRETSVGEAIIEMYLAGASTGRIEDVSKILWGAGVSAGMVGSIADVFPKAKYQRCTVHFYRNVLAKIT